MLNVVHFLLEGSHFCIIFSLILLQPQAASAAQNGLLCASLEATKRHTRSVMSSQPQPLSFSLPCQRCSLLGPRDILGCAEENYFSAASPVRLTRVMILWCSVYSSLTMKVTDWARILGEREGVGRVPAVLLRRAIKLRYQHC